MSLESRIQAALKRNLPWYLIFLANVAIGTILFTVALAIASKLINWVDFNLTTPFATSFVYAFAIYNDNKAKEK